MNRCASKVWWMREVVRVKSEGIPIVGERLPNGTIVILDVEEGEESRAARED